MHVLEAGFEAPGRPLVLLLHGFPELAWSWRKVMPALAAAGFHVVAPDQRGFGRTTGWDPAYDGDLASFRPLSLMQDLLSLIFSMDYGSVTAVVGHDFGSPVAAHCALIRPDIFSAVVMMSAPFAGPPPAGIHYVLTIGGKDEPPFTGLSDVSKRYGVGLWENPSYDPTTAPRVEIDPDVPTDCELDLPGS